MLASTWFDVVVGLDVHLEITPTGAPILLPHPYLGLTFDPLGMMGDLLWENKGVPAGAETHGPVFINNFPATTVGTCSRNIPLPHFVLPPGISWANPPHGEGIVIAGSKTVTILESPAARLLDVGKSCSHPVPLPTSMVVAIPKGAPVLIGGPSSFSIGDAALSFLRAKFLEHTVFRLLGKWIDRIKKDRLRNFLSKALCIFTGHPVDVATGRLMTWATDFELPGPLPLTFERTYASSWSHRDSPLGFGWSHSLDRAVWLELGKVVYRDGEGREIEFDTFDRPGHTMHPGDEQFEPISGLTLRCTGPFAWQIENRDGTLEEFGRLPGERAHISRITFIRSRDGHAIRFEYDALGRLAWVHDSAGRAIKFEYDAAGRITRILLPHPTHDGFCEHRRFVYSRDGDLVEVHDALGGKWRFVYDGHLLVQETDRTGLSFYFGYDGRGAEASCVRTWGDGGIFDHEIAYDKKNHVTTVTNSLGATTVYHMNEAFAVTKVVDPHGFATAYEYDDALRKTTEIDALGNATRWEYDARGNCTKVTRPDGATTIAEYDAHDAPALVHDPLGGAWRWKYDAQGRLVSRTNPMAERETFRHEGGFPSAFDRADGQRTQLLHDRAGNLLRVRTPDDAETKFEYDRLGRVIAETDAAGHTTRFRYDAHGQLVRAEQPDGTTIELAYDAEGNLVERRAAGRRVRFTYSGFHALASQEEGGAAVRFRYDTEDQLLEIENENHEIYRLVRDACGNVAEEYGFDGRKRWYERDACGRVTAIHKPSRRTTKIEYDAAGRTMVVRSLAPNLKVESEETFAYRPDGALVEATNATTSVRLERDALGRVIKESQGDDWIASQYDLNGERISVESSRGTTAHIQRGLMGDADGVEVGGWKASFAHDVLGLERERALPGGVVMRWERDRLGRPKSRHVLRGGAELESQSYRWRRDDTLAEIVDRKRGKAHFGHDDRGRLMVARYPDGATQCLVPDAAGNVFRRPDHSDRVYGPGGELREADGTKYVHDEDGQLVEKIEPRGKRWQYAWDGAGNLAEVTRPDGTKVAFAYDALGRRVRKRHGERVTTWLWDGHVPLHEQTTDAELVTWIFEPESFTPLGKIEGDRRYGIVTDHLGTPTSLHDEAGRIAWQMQLDLYGVPQKPPQETRPYGIQVQTDVAHTSCPWRFPGQYADEETGLYYNRFRYYDPKAGRYVSPDPLSLKGGLNAFQYVQDPTSWIDPYGLAACNEARRKRLSQVHTFWSGKGAKERAAAWARRHGGITLEMTGAGKLLERHSQRLDWIEAFPAWVKRSKRFAKEASGKVHIFVTEEALSRPTSILNTVELPILQDNPTVEIVWHVLR